MCVCIQFTDHPLENLVMSADSPVVNVGIVRIDCWHPFYNCTLCPVFVCPFGNPATDPAHFRDSEIRLLLPFRAAYSNTLNSQLFNHSKRICEEKPVMICASVFSAV